MRQRPIPCVYVSLVCLAWAATAAAATHTVTSIAELQARIDTAVPGDTIVVRNGVYTISAAITVETQGTEGAPIRIAAQSVGGVEITGTHGFDVRSPAMHVEITGFLFTHRAGTTRVRSGATHIRFTRNIFECNGEGAYLQIAGDHAQVIETSCGTRARSAT